VPSRSPEGVDWAGHRCLIPWLVIGVVFDLFCSVKADLIVTRLELVGKLRDRGLTLEVVDHVKTRRFNRWHTTPTHRTNMTKCCTSSACPCWNIFTG
jgi:hypothetical protein